MSAIQDSLKALAINKSSAYCIKTDPFFKNHILQILEKIVGDPGKPWGSLAHVCCILPQVNAKGYRGSGWIGILKNAVHNLITEYHLAFAGINVIVVEGSGTPG